MAESRDKLNRRIYALNLINANLKSRLDKAERELTMRKKVAKTRRLAKGQAFLDAKASANYAARLQYRQSLDISHN